MPDPTIPPTPYTQYRRDLQWIIRYWNHQQVILIDLFVRATKWPGDAYALAAAITSQKKQVSLSEGEHKTQSDNHSSAEPAPSVLSTLSSLRNPDNVE